MTLLCNTKNSVVSNCIQKNHSTQKVAPPHTCEALELLQSLAQTCPEKGVIHGAAAECGKASVSLLISVDRLESDHVAG
jgi:hypothetical protein